MYLVRHGQASFDSENYDQLSPIGEQQSQWLGSYFSERDITFDAVIIGTQIRHKQTADAICQKLDFTGDYHFHAGLNEYDFFALYQALCCEDESLDKNIRNVGKLNFLPLLKKALNLWSKNQLDGELPESWAEYVARVVQAINFICSMKAKRVLVISSGGPISIVAQQALQCPEQMAIELNLQIKNASFCHYFIGKQTLRLASFNNIPHLDHPERIETISYG